MNAGAARFASRGHARALALDAASRTRSARVLAGLALLVGCTALVGCAAREQQVRAQLVAHVAQTHGAWRLVLALLLGLALSLLGSLPMTGPLALLVLDRVVIGQRRAAFWIALSGALVEGAIAAAIAALLPLVLEHSASIVRIARVSGAFVIFGVGLALVLRPQTVSQLETEHKRQSLLVGFLATSLNPTLLATWTIAVTTLNAHGLLDGGFQEGPLFGGGVVIGVLAWFGALLLLARLGSAERMNRYRAALGRSVGGILLLVSALTFLRAFESNGGAELPAEQPLEAH